MIKKFDNYINEGVRDEMKPKSEEDIKNTVSQLSPWYKIKVGAKNNVPWLVQQGFDEKTTKTFNQNSLREFMFDALYAGYDEVVDILLTNGIRLDDEDMLISAISGGSVDTIKILLKHGINIDSIDSEFNRIYDYIEYNNKIDAIQYIVDNSVKFKNRLGNRVADLEKEAKLIKQYL